MLLVWEPFLETRCEELFELNWKKNIHSLYDWVGALYLHCISSMCRQKFTELTPLIIFRIRMSPVFHSLCFMYCEGQNFLSYTDKHHELSAYFIVLANSSRKLNTPKSTWSWSLSGLFYPSCFSICPFHWEVLTEVSCSGWAIWKGWWNMGSVYAFSSSANCHAGFFWGIWGNNWVGPKGRPARSLKHLDGQTLCFLRLVLSISQDIRLRRLLSGKKRKKKISWFKFPFTFVSVALCCLLSSMQPQGSPCPFPTDSSLPSLVSCSASTELPFSSWDWARKPGSHWVPANLDRSSS